MSLQEQYLQDIANAIRQKSGTSESIIAKDFANAILAIPTSEPEPEPGPKPDPGSTLSTLPHNLSVLHYAILNNTKSIECIDIALQNPTSLNISCIVSTVIGTIQVGECVHREADTI